jgi:hypothetical protein
MTISLYHQVGHNWNWNKDSLVDDKCGDGLVLSPVHQTKTNIEKLSVPLRKVCIFDPQYYLPNSQKQKLHTYNFFPEALVDGFTSANFAIKALESARLCLQFQINMQFQWLVIPARYFDQLDPDYTERQDSYTVAPFLSAAKELGVSKPLMLTLPVTSHMLEIVKYRTQLLNWVTSFPEISGVYIFAANDRDTKQPASAEFLLAYLTFLSELRSAGLQVLVGYTNTEALLFTMLDEVALTMGAFENTRIFSIDKFVSKDEERRGPKARIYVPGLLNWIQFDQAKQIKAKLPQLWKEIHFDSAYAERAFELVVEPQFNQAPLYKHYFQAFSAQVDRLKPLEPSGRAQLLRSWIATSSDAYAEIKRSGIDLEKHGAGGHLPGWRSAINSFSQ